MNFKEKLVYVRAYLNLTQVQLAKELNVSFETINRWESGKYNPSRKAIYTFEIFCKKNNIIFEVEDKA